MGLMGLVMLGAFFSIYCFTHMLGLQSYLLTRCLGMFGEGARRVQIPSEEVLGALTHTAELGSKGKGSFKKREPSGFGRFINHDPSLGVVNGNS